MSVRILHLITGLETGGAELALQGLLRAMASHADGRFEHRVVSLVRPGYAGRKLAQLGVSVAHLGMERSVPSPGALFRLVSMIRTFQPQVLQTWLYHADLLGLLGSWLAVGVRVPVVWNLRCGYMDFSQYPRMTGWTVSALSRLSRFPVAIVANAQAAVDHHQRLGYRPRRVEVIPNGVDVDRFRPAAGAGTSLRSELGLAPDTLLAGLAARFDPMKGVPLLLAGLGEVPALHLLLCGQGMEPGNEALRACISAAEKECPGIENRVHLAGHRADLERVLPGLDMYVSASLGESFPNVIAEAMACEVPVVATDVGASRALLVPEGGEAAGRIVAPFDGAALGRAMAEMAALPASAREELGRAGRARVAKEYSWAACARRYAALYRDIA